MTAFKKPITAIIIGAGGRGMTYAQYAQLFAEELKIVGVAEPREWNRQFMQRTYQIPPENVFQDWREASSRPRLADAVFICTQDPMHVEPAIAFAEKGYAMLLEKPISPNEQDCQRVIQAVHKNHILFGVCHVLRYTQYTKTLKSILNAGAIGEVVSIEHLEPVGYWHQAHSYVRGNWGNQSKTSFMLLTKSCHDLDWLSYMIGQPCVSLSSFGALNHFKKSEKPAAAGNSTRCLECGFELQCAYSAKKIYLGRLRASDLDWPLNILSPEPTLETVTAALQNGPYGRCVYECDNDVVDHQVVNLLFKNNATASFTMTAFTRQADRKTRIFGTLGEITGDGEKIDIYDFLTDQTRTIDLPHTSNDANGKGVPLGGHGGGDFGLMQSFVAAVAQDDPRLILSGPDESLASHRMVFAAEKARLENKVVNL